MVSHRLSFFDLRLFPDRVRLPNHFSGLSLLITNHSAASFIVSGTRLTRPDFFQNSLVSIHGVGVILYYTLFGKDPPSLAPVFHVGEVIVEGDQDMVPAPSMTVLKNGAPYFRDGFWLVWFVWLLGLFTLFWAFRDKD